MRGQVMSEFRRREMPRSGKGSKEFRLLWTYSAGTTPTLVFRRNSAQQILKNTSNWKRTSADCSKSVRKDCSPPRAENDSREWHYGLQLARVRRCECSLGGVPLLTRDHNTKPEPSLYVKSSIRIAVIPSFLNAVNAKSVMENPIHTVVGFFPN